MTESQDKFIKLLKEMFQFDQADLDFGIYRIMNEKRNEINKFMSEDLPHDIDKGLASLENSATKEQVKKIEEQIKAAKSMDLDPAMKSSMISKLEEQKEKFNVATNTESTQDEIYNNLLDFFSRYYDEGDFISQRRYSKGKYAIPYEGEEVKLHWANADQYYIKTSEYFKDYTFVTTYGNRVHFKILDAQVEQNNNKSKEKKYFQLADKEKPFEVVDGELYIYVQYKEGTLKQKTYNEKIIEAFIKWVNDNTSESLNFAAIIKKEKGQDSSILEKELNHYTAKNSFDYFIHKDLRGFLTQELDFFIKNEVIRLDDIDETDEAKTKLILTKAKVLRDIAKKIIAFLAQLEEFQKKLFLKKKFVTETNYCITLDRIDESFYEEIAKNEDQRKEWVKLFAIDEIKATDGNLFEQGKTAYSEPLTIQFLKENPYLVLDTAFFSEEFKEKLIASIDDFDEKLDGLLINSENFQALQLLQQKYSRKISCVYGDPPYNAKTSEILYKNSFKHSSWIAMMMDRLVLAAKLKEERGALVTAIDENEGFNLVKLEDMLFPFWEKTVVSILHNPAGVQGDNFSYSHEYAVFLFENYKHVIGKTDKEEKSVEPFRDWGPSGTRNSNGNTFYAIKVDLEGKNIVGFGDACNSSFHPNSQNIIKEDYIEIYPIGDDGDERKWVFARETVEEITKDLFVSNNNGVFQIMRNKSKGSFKTVWTDKKYYANIHGSQLLNDMMGNKKFDFPKSVYTVQDCVYAVKNVQKNDGAIILDYFAGSGTTGHAVINLNREDNKHRKYILCEMGDYFDTVTKPRVEKVIYSKDWKDGKPVSREGSSHAFKYIRLESYEDTLNNIARKSIETDLNDDLHKDYFLNYIMDFEAKESDSLLNLEKLAHPFDYTMKITRKQECDENHKIDLVETFNYLIGLKVSKNHAFDSKYRIKAIEGNNRNGENILVIWRDLSGDTEQDNAVLDEFFEQYRSSGTRFDFKKVYVNGDNNLLNLKSENEIWDVALIELEMKKRMFSE